MNGYIVDLRQLTADDHWDDKLPASLQPALKLDGNHVAVSMNVHRFDSMFANGKILSDNVLCRERIAS